ncbi:MAG: PAS domain S-box protein [Coprothermobacterota bacterium]|nr:PAS domain S-box protein [Coprothermobacterota bacterium]
MMGKPLAVLLVEDSKSDAELLVRLLSKTGYEVRYERVETADQMRAALDLEEQPAWDLVIADYSLPQFDAPAALEILHKTNLDLPFIVVSGSIGEEIAVEMMRAGAHDYLMKGNLARLAPAVERELAQAVVRRGRKQAEEALSKSEFRYRTLFEKSNEGILFLSTDLEIAMVNESFAKMHGYSVEEMQNMNLGDLDTIETSQLTAERMAHLMAGHTMNFEVEHYHKDGHIFPLEVSASLISVGSEEIIQSFHRDITERKRLEQETAKARAEFLFAVSHELKTPLFLMVSSQELLESLPSEQRAECFLEYREIWRRNLIRLRQIIENLVDSQRAPGMGMKLEKQSLSAAAVAEEVIKELEPVAHAKEVKLILEAEPLPEVALDSRAWKRLLENLLTNAIKFSPAGGEVRTRFTRLDEGFQMAVIDRGSGIAPQAMPFLFEPFYRSPEALRTGIQGTGLGLYVVKTIADAHGCSVEVESEEGKGTIVTVRLPWGGIIGT